MEKSLNYTVEPKENLYFILKIIAAIFGYFVIFASIASLISHPQATSFIPLMVYLIVIVVYIFFRLALIIGYLKGNAVKVTKNQFPDIHKIVVKQCGDLGIRVPEVFVWQNGGVLNAFATRFMGSGYVVIYSDILEEAYAGNIEAVEFVIGHELGHIKRNHIPKRLWLFPAFIVPFLNRAYSRACEYTCDNIGAALSPTGARSGLLLLAAGKKLRTHVNPEAFSQQQHTEFGFWQWMAEKLSTHPMLSKRVSRFKGMQKHSAPLVKETVLIQRDSSDHSAFLPKN